jgi:hypothetical protein
MDGCVVGVFRVGNFYGWVSRTQMYQKVTRLHPQTTNRWNNVNACAMLESKERRHTVFQVRCCVNTRSCTTCLSPRGASYL